MKRRGIFWTDNLGWWLLAIFVLVVVLVGYGIITGKLGGIVKYIGDVLRFGR